MSCPAVISRLAANLRFACTPKRLHVGDRVELTAPARYLARLAPDHLPAVPAGTRAVIRAIAPMPGTAGGAIVDLLDMAGVPSGYWTGIALTQLRPIRGTVLSDHWRHLPR